MEEIFSYTDEMMSINNDEEPDKNEMNYKAKKSSRSSATSFAFDWIKAMLVSFSVVVLLLTFAFRLVTIEGDSMMYTLLNGDKAILTTFNYTPHNGDIVAIAHGGHLDKTIIKRIIATEGQSVKLDAEKGQVIVDGIILDEPYIAAATTRQADWELPEIIPEGYVFVLGDNRPVSKDSRSSDVGLIPADDIIGKAQFIISPINRISYLY